MTSPHASPDAGPDTGPGAPPRYPRDLHGHGARPPEARWPGGARIAVQIVVNYEEGGESCALHGDPASEAFLSEIPGAEPWPGERHWNMESVYEYGARAGFWRLHRLLAEMPVTVFGVAMALARSPAQTRAMLEAGWEVACHGLKWVEHRAMPEAEERAQMAEAIALHEAATGARPTGWYTGRCSMGTVRLAAEQGFDWLADSYADDLPYWVRVGGRDQLMVPYALDANDMRFSAPAGFGSGPEFEAYLRDSFEHLHREGGRMMSVGLHCRLAGRPGRAEALRRFLDHARAHEGVWFATRGQIAEHWAREHPPREPFEPFAAPPGLAGEDAAGGRGRPSRGGEDPGAQGGGAGGTTRPPSQVAGEGAREGPDGGAARPAGAVAPVRDGRGALPGGPGAAGEPRPSTLGRAAFVARFGGVFEHSPWVAERAWASELGPAHDTAVGLHAALARAFREGSPEERLGVLRAHPDLAGKLAAARRLTPESAAEQGAAGLDALTDEERAAFERLNAAYAERHAIPFIVAVRDHDRAGILALFERRLDNPREVEIAEACAQVLRIAELRLAGMLS